MPAQKEEVEKNLIFVAGMEFGTIYTAELNRG